MSFIAGVKTDNGWGARSFDNVPDCWRYLVTVVADVTEDPSVLEHLRHVTDDMNWECQPLIDVMYGAEDRGEILDWFWCAEG